jgi:hypothetical protein
MNKSKSLFEVARALHRLVAEANHGLMELSKLEKEGRGTEVLPEAVKAREAIRATAMFDAKGEYETLLQKLGRGPVVDKDAVGPVAVNVKMIRNWFLADLARLNSVIERTDAMKAGTHDSAVESNNQMSGMLLRALGAEMLEAFGKMADALDAVVKMDTSEAAES